MSMRSDTSTDESPLDFDDEPPRRRRRGWIIAVVVLVLLAGGYAAAAWYLADRVPRGATVAGVDIGGLTSAEATERLDEELSGLAESAVPVTMGSTETTFEPASLELDTAATVEELSELSFDPRTLFAQLFGGEEHAPVV